MNNGIKPLWDLRDRGICCLHSSEFIVEIVLIGTVHTDSLTVNKYNIIAYISTYFVDFIE